MVRQRGRLWQADVRTPEGNRLRPTFRTEASANHWEAEAKAAIRDGCPIPKAYVVPRTDSGRDLSLLGNLYDFVCRTEWTTISSAHKTKALGQQVVDHFGRNKPVADIKSADIAEYKAGLSEGGNAPATVNRKLAALSKMLRVASETGFIDKMPKIKRNPEVKTRFRYLDIAEEHVLLSYWEAGGLLDQRDLTTFLIDTGARCFSEAMVVNWNQFGPQFSSVSFWKTKTGKPRTVPLTARVREMLAKRKKQFGDRHDGPFIAMKYSPMRSQWEHMREVLDFHDVTPHVLRHTCCTRLVLGGADIKRVMQWMGHSAIVTTMRYMQIKPTALEDILHVLEGFPQKTSASA